MLLKFFLFLQCNATFSDITPYERSHGGKEGGSNECQEKGERGKERKKERGNEVYDSGSFCLNRFKEPRLDGL